MDAVFRLSQTPQLPLLISIGKEDVGIGRFSEECCQSGTLSKAAPARCGKVPMKRG